MATYNSAYRYNPQRRKKQRYVLIERVIDFTNNLPYDANKRNLNTDPTATIAWAAGDILEAVGVLAGQTVIDVQVEVMTKSTDSGDFITIGDGNNRERWGLVNLYHTSVPTAAQLADIGLDRPAQWAPFYYSSADTIDIYIGKAALQGKIRLIVHMLEDDR